MRESNTRAIAELNSRITNIAFEVTNNGPKPKTVRQPDLRRNTLGIASAGTCRINEVPGIDDNNDGKESEKGEEEVNCDPHRILSARSRGGCIIGCM